MRKITVGVAAASACNAAATAAATPTEGKLITGEPGLCLWLHINGSGLLLCKSLSHLICIQYFSGNSTARVIDISLKMTVSSKETRSRYIYGLKNKKKA